MYTQLPNMYSLYNAPYQNIQDDLEKQKENYIKNKPTRVESTLGKVASCACGISALTYLALKVLKKPEALETCRKVVNNIISLIKI